jgi:hypothetical protein
MKWSTGCAGSAPFAAHRTTKPAVLAAGGDELVAAAVAAVQPQEAMCQDAALEKGIELVFDELGQLTAPADLCLRDQAGSVLLYQALQRGLLGTVELVVDPDAARRPTAGPEGRLMPRPRWPTARGKHHGTWLR